MREGVKRRTTNRNTENLSESESGKRSKRDAARCFRSTYSACEIPWIFRKRDDPKTDSGEARLTSILDCEVEPA
jgi:hypothetical protein